jgi:hypothetical protein
MWRNEGKFMRQLLRFALFGLVLVPGLVNLLHAGTLMFNFEADTGSSNPFTSTSTIAPGTATFTSPGTYTVLPSFFQTLTGNVLFGDGSNLTIAFSVPVTSISLNFGEGSAVSVHINASCLNVANCTSLGAVGSNSATGGTPPGTAFPEGVLSFNGGTFDTVVLSSSTTFAIDNVTAAAAASAVPEPGSFLLCGGVLTALAFVRLRRRSS